MNGLRVAVILVNWNGRRHLEACLPGLAAQRYRDFMVIVADNGSTDGSLAWLAAAWPNVRALDLGGNLGFAAGNNHAIRTTTAPWIALLNNDTIPDPGWLGLWLPPPKRMRASEASPAACASWTNRRC